jgi:hypothetical protein
VRKRQFLDACVVRVVHKIQEQLDAQHAAVGALQACVGHKRLSLCECLLRFVHAYSMLNAVDVVLCVVRDDGDL